MAVLSHREVLPRTYDHKLGGSPTATRNFVATLDEPTAHNDILAAVGIELGALHPEHNLLTCDSISIDETDRHHATVSCTYALPEIDDPDQPPYMQPDQWSFSTSSSSIACTDHYPDATNNFRIRTITNAAGDVITGLSKSTTDLKITITGARQFLDIRQVEKITNSINNGKWIGFPQRTVFCNGISATPAKIEYNGQVIEYWQLNIELIYRPSGWGLILPNVGWNVIVDGKKQRAWAYIEVDGVREKVPAPEKVALNIKGGWLCGPQQDQPADDDGDGQPNEIPI